MLDPQEANRHERHQIGHIRWPLVQQIVDELSRVGRLGQVQDQQGQCDGEDAVDERVKSSWSQSWSPTSSDGRSCATSTQVTTCDKRHGPVLAVSVPERPCWGAAQMGDGSQGWPEAVRHDRALGSTPTRTDHPPLRPSRLAQLCSAERAGGYGAGMIAACIIGCLRTSADS